ncbi:hypothetical protein [Methanosarcina sp.]|uniref:hypothetical protein n=1 Tax=Methanosarcina sp. TaxID=2213 RepID=UPI002AB81EBD|nr:hypothetical protein [Methanosarcina sp.]MDY9925900.1 hypothetical protein [Methanosarcina sp.]
MLIRAAVSLVLSGSTWERTRFIIWDSITPALIPIKANPVSRPSPLTFTLMVAIASKSPAISTSSPTWIMRFGAMRADKRDAVSEQLKVVWKGEGRESLSALS